MSLQMVWSVYGVLGVVFGLGYLLMPTALLGFFGVTDGPAAALAARFAGSSMLGLGVMSWLARGSGAGERSTQALLLGLGLISALGAVLSAMGTLAATFNSYGWLAAVVFAVLAALAGWKRFGRG